MIPDAPGYVDPPIQRANPDLPGRCLAKCPWGNTTKEEGKRRGPEGRLERTNSDLGF